MTKEKQRDPLNVTNMTTFHGLSGMSDLDGCVLDWRTLLSAHELDGHQLQEINVTNPSYLAVVAQFQDEKFEMIKLLSGAKEQLPRWKRALRVVDDAMWEPVGKLYCQKHFPAEAKTQAKELVNQLLIALKHRIKGLQWMTEATKAKALEKADMMGVKIGYPDRWCRDFSKLRIDRDHSFVQHQLNLNAFEADYQISQIGKARNPDEWLMSPQTVNAYYAPDRNEIVFPAGILQAPFFDAKAHPASNYGGIGAVIGHEMTHAFDDSGRKFDGKGNLTDWWTPADAAAFEKIAKRIVQQYNKEVYYGVHVNGELTQGENIADNGGLRIAYEALQNVVATAPQSAATSGKYSPDQDFFFSWAKAWRNTQRKESAITQMTTDPHSPDPIRINVPLSNMPEFYAAFGVKPGNKLYRAPEDQVQVW